MYYRLKVNSVQGNKQKITTYLTTGNNFAEAAQKTILTIGTDPEIEEIKLMKNFKPAINEKYSDSNKLYMVKIAEDVKQDNDAIKTIKYELPVFANNSNELQNIVNDYISQGLDNMRLTTISETKWIYIN